MASIDLTQETFDETLENNDIVIIDFWAEWCGPCKKFAPIFEKVAEAYPDVLFAKVNTEEQQALALKYNVRAVPTLMVVRDGVTLLNTGGMLPEDKFGDMIAHVKNLDMDEIREELAQNEDDD
ncbi:thioredoxin [Sulfurimonas aquatica]|uniref:Thioredoxin n=1 Tax=Sulfurimonas aquatica TaxID=2672570 RepID=A0A975AYU1_9BACT|nr:thioredoxin [Sulfurimonas aquatica]QSZ41081.1 thioredoxin [Sulfurimonas aquatica]